MSSIGTPDTRYSSLRDRARPLADPTAVTALPAGQRKSEQESECLDASVFERLFAQAAQHRLRAARDAPMSSENGLHD